MKRIMEKSVRDKCSHKYKIISFDLSKWCAVCGECLDEEGGNL